MSIETLLPLAEALPSSPATPSLPPASGAPASASLQERRLRAARELDVRIHCLEQETVRLATSLEVARREAREHLGELQQRSTSLTTEVLRVGARLARQGREQEAQRRQLDQRLCQQLRELEAALVPLGESLQAQAQQLHDLQSRHETLSRLHQHLDRIVTRHGRGLDIVAAEFGQRFELLRISLEGMQALFRDQQASQMRIAVEQEGLSAVTQAMQARLDDTRAGLAQHRDETRRRLGVLASLLAALAMLSLGLIAWCQFHPVALPAAAQERMATIDARLGLQDSSDARLQLELTRHTGTLDALQQDLQQLRHDNQLLREQARRQQARLLHMARQMAAATAPSAARADAPFPDTAPLPLPTALPGSRPEY